MPEQAEIEKYGPQPFVPGSDADVFSERHTNHDVGTTRKSIETMLANGTPNWVKWPHDYAAYAKESFREEKERSDKMGVEYRWFDQEVLTNREARQVNPINTRDFVEHKLKANSIQAVVFASDWKNYGGGATVGLWCNPPNRDKLRYVCYLDAPFMWEWSILHLDSHGIPSGEESRGWRTVAAQLVEKDIISERQCHQIFGAPGANANSARYYRTLWEKRHGRPYQDEEERGLEG